MLQMQGKIFDGTSCLKLSCSLLGSRAIYPVFLTFYQSSAIGRPFTPYLPTFDLTGAIIDEVWIHIGRHANHQHSLQHTTPNSMSIHYSPVNHETKSTASAMALNTGQDGIVLALMGDNDDSSGGYFIDLAANHAFRLSNTYTLEKHNWFLLLRARRLATQFLFF